VGVSARLPRAHHTPSETNTIIDVATRANRRAITVIAAPQTQNRTPAEYTKKSVMINNFFRACLSPYASTKSCTFIFEHLTLTLTALLCCLCCKIFVTLLKQYYMVVSRACHIAKRIFFWLFIDSKSRENQRLLTANEMCFAVSFLPASRMLFKIDF
jgi:hypothetical protein